MSESEYRPSAQEMEQGESEVTPEELRVALKEILQSALELATEEQKELALVEMTNTASELVNAASGLNEKVSVYIDEATSQLEDAEQINEVVSELYPLADILGVDLPNELIERGVYS